MARCFHTLGVRIKQPTGPASRFLLTYLDSNRILPYDPPPPTINPYNVEKNIHSLSCLLISIINR